MSQTNEFFAQNGDKQLADIPMTFNQLYTIFKQRSEQEAAEQLKQDWPTPGISQA